MRANLVAIIVAVALPAYAEPVRIDISAPHVIGVSGLEITGQGTGFVAVSDAGWFLTGQLTRDAGVLTGGEVVAVLPILGNNGFPVRARRVGDWSDAEGIALHSDGTMYVSFERWARVARYPAQTAKGEWIEDHPDFVTYEENSELEAVAVTDNGSVFTLPEAPTENGQFPLFRLDPDGWSQVALVPGSEAFLMVGADFGPDGHLYLLERKLVFATWWQSRLRSYNLETRELVTIWETQPNEMGNLEGVSVWQAEDGLRATMISDNNGRPNVPTEIVEIRLTE